MFTEITRAVRPALVLLTALAAITGLAFPASITFFAQALMPYQANGSLMLESGRVIGSTLIAQGFTGARYFHPRASAAGKGYDASASAATNLAPGSKDLRDAIATRVAAAREEGARANGMTTGSVPPDLVTTSASGLDPDLSPEAAFAQLPRVARARGLDPARLRTIVDEATQYPLLGIVGDPHVNVLLLNRQLDGLSPNAR